MIRQKSLQYYTLGISVYKMTGVIVSINSNMNTLMVALASLYV